jgi:hypothetical protein
MKKNTQQNIRPSFSQGNRRHPDEESVFLLIKYTEPVRQTRRSTQ